MTDILLEMSEYLAEKVNLTLGVNIFYNELPDEPAKCVFLKELKSTYQAPSQIDISRHKVSILVRDVSNTAAQALAAKCYRWLLTSDELFDTDRSAADTSGFIKLPSGNWICVSFLSEPVWEKVDQQKRKYFCFDTIITTSRI